MSDEPTKVPEIDTPDTDTIALYTIPKVSAGARATAYLAMRALGKPKGLERMRHVAVIRKGIMGTSIVDPDTGGTIWDDDKPIVLHSQKELETLRNAVRNYLGEGEGDDVGEGIAFDLVEDGLEIAAACDSAVSLALRIAEGAETAAAAEAPIAALPAPAAPPPE